jgi:hypothetical protein
MQRGKQESIAEFTARQSEEEMDWENIGERDSTEVRESGR